MSGFHLIEKRQAMILSPDFILPLSSSTNIKPTIVMIKYGSNDLAKGKNPLSVVPKVIDLCHEILKIASSCKKSHSLVSSSKNELLRSIIFLVFISD